MPYYYATYTRVYHSFVLLAYYLVHFDWAGGASHIRDIMLEMVCTFSVSSHFFSAISVLCNFCVKAANGEQAGGRSIVSATEYQMQFSQMESRFFEFDFDFCSLARFSD